MASYFPRVFASTPSPTPYMGTESLSQQASLPPLQTLGASSPVPSPASAYGTPRSPFIPASPASLDRFETPAEGYVPAQLARPAGVRSLSAESPGSPEYAPGLRAAAIAGAPNEREFNQLLVEQSDPRVDIAERMINTRAVLYGDLLAAFGEGTLEVLTRVNRKLPLTIEGFEFEPFVRTMKRAMTQPHMAMMHVSFPDVAADGTLTYLGQPLRAPTEVNLIPIISALGIPRIDPRLRDLSIILNEFVSNSGEQLPNSAQVSSVSRAICDKLTQFREQYSRNEIIIAGERHSQRVKEHSV